MKVAILPTGRTEWSGLARALGRLFPQHTFYCLPTEASQATDPESFVTDDATYLAATEADCPTLAALTRDARKAAPKWLGSQPREHHSKGYLQWLCRAPEERTCTGYSETSRGGPALADISWPELFSRDAAHFGPLRAVVEDLADGGAPQQPPSASTVC